MWKQNRVRAFLQIPRWNDGIAQYGEKAESRPIETNHKNSQPKTITEMFTEAIQEKTGQPRRYKKKQVITKRIASNTPKIETSGMGVPHLFGYVPRFKYNGYLKKCTWIPLDESKNPKKSTGASKEEKWKYSDRTKERVCLLMAFAGQNYTGMQYNGEGIETIEKHLFNAMIKYRWILPEHIRNLGSIGFEHGSRTDAGVSAARMYCSLTLPKDINVSDLNNDLPFDIRVFGVKPTAPKFNARLACSARTYSYTMPTIALSEYTDLTKLQDYRVTPNRLQLASEIFSLYVGERNYHNYTSKKKFYDPLVQRRIISIEISEPFIQSDIEFCRVLIEGQSFILHQIRKIIATTLATLRNIIDHDYIHRSFTAEKLNLPLAPGLGLMLERLHFTQYASLYPNNDPLDFVEFNNAVEEFRKAHIDPIIIEKEINENAMANWLEILAVHTYDLKASSNKPELWYHDPPSAEWGESPEFIAKLKAMEKEE